jgi:hypothetical protein
LQDFLKPISQGSSFRGYYQGDCKLFRVKELSYSFHTLPMGEGNPFISSNKPEAEWYYPPPESVGEYLLNAVCKR